MRCSSCGSDNPDGLKFCNQCGTAFKARCLECGFDNAPGARFCGECGTSLTTEAPGRPPIEQPAQAVGGLETRSALRFGERRHLTVLFCDLVGSSELAARLDPEEWQQTVSAYHRAVAAAIGRFGGQVAKYLGDGVMAYFGYPEAHDNDAERAARAGLAILEAITRLNQHPSGAKLSARIGIDSGAVVVGAGAGTETDIFGEAPNIAARVQAAADPDTVLISAATHRLVAGLFVVEDCGARALKGVKQPVQLYRVIQPAGVRGRLAAAAALRGLTSFVGREDELRTLASRWQRVLDGEGQAVLIVGEAGIGKSRLVQKFHQQIAGIPHTWIEAAAAPFYQNTPFYPVADLLRQLVWEQSLDRLDEYLRELQNHAGMSGKQRGDQQLDQLQAGLVSAGLTPAEALPLIAPLLHLPLSAQYAPSSLSPEQQRRHLLATLIEWLMGAAQAQPLVIDIEDLHWADPSTLELIQLLLGQGATARMLILCTARPEFHAEWPLRAHHTQITLNRLSARNVREMIAQVAARDALAGDTLDAMVERTSGVPLFVEELTRAVLESGNAKLSAREIPVTLHDSLMARLDRLGSAKEVLQVGSVIGGEFSYELLHAVHSLSEQDLQRELRKLTDADLLYVRGIVPDATYRFKHALIRDAAYEALLKSRRRELHRLIARTIDEKFPDLKDAHPEVLARHWTEAIETELAISEWSKAGKAAESRNAFAEALESFQQAVSLVAQLPETPERDLREFELRQSIYTMLYLTRGLATPEATQAIERAVTLAEKTGKLNEYASYISSRGFSAFFAGDLSTASALADQILALGVREGSPTMLAHAHFLGIVTRYLSGDLEGAERHFAAGSGLFSDAGFRRNPGTTIAAFAGASLSAWALGRSDVARKRESQMMVMVNVNSPYDVASGHTYAANLRVLLREYEQAERLAAQALELSEKHQLGYLTQYSRCILGQARSQLGSISEGIALLRDGIAGSIDSGLGLRSGYFTATIAAAQELEGSLVGALETVEVALKTNSDELFYRPETFRLRGEIRVKLSQPELAQVDFRESIALARTMGAKAWELRTTMSLVRLLDEQGHRDEARKLLTEIYNWFTEGFDTSDLKDAKTLLDRLMS